MNELQNHYMHASYPPAYISEWHALIFATNNCKTKICIHSSFATDRANLKISRRSRNHLKAFTTIYTCYSVRGGVPHSRAIYVFIDICHSRKG